MTEPLLKIAREPVTVPHTATVGEAVEAMVDRGLGAVAVLENRGIIGVFTERDLMVSVVHRGLDPAKTPVAEVMVPTPICVPPETHRQDAVQIMVEHRFRHLPVADETGCLMGMLSLRDLLDHQLGRLREEVNSLELYLSVDGPGG